MAGTSFGQLVTRYMILELQVWRCINGCNADMERLMGEKMVNSGITLRTGED
jgi:hypothetical protein